MMERSLPTPQPVRPRPQEERAMQASARRATTMLVLLAAAWLAAACSEECPDSAVTASTTCTHDTLP